MKVIIAGCRDFENYSLLKEKCNFYLSSQTDIEIVSGRCDRGVHTFTTNDGIKIYGADGLGERYAKEMSCHVKPFPADWSLGKIAGPKRNAQMAFYADALIAFWDEKSRGTKNMIDLATEKGMKVKIVKY